MSTLSTRSGHSRPRDRAVSPGSCSLRQNSAITLRIVARRTRAEAREAALQAQLTGEGA